MERPPDRNGRTSILTFEQLVASRGPALQRFGYSLTGHTAEAEDLVQESLAKAYRRWGDVVTVERPEAYVRQVMVNTWISWWRRGRRHAPPPVGVVGVGDVGVGDVGVDDGRDQHAQQDLVWTLLADMPRRQRAVLVLRYHEGLTDTEIAEVLDCRPGTVRSLAARAFAVLRQIPELSDLHRVPARGGT